MSDKTLRKHHFTLIVVIALLAIAGLSAGANIMTSQKAAKATTEQEKKLAALKQLSSEKLKRTAQAQGESDKAMNTGKLLIESKMSDFGTKVETLEDALAQISVEPKLPNPAVAGDPKAIYVIDSAEPEQIGIGLEYERGMEIWIRPNKPSPDYDYDLKKFSRVKSLDIDGFKGTQAEYNKKTLAEIGEVSEVAAVVWYENGTEYYIYGDREGRVRLTDLLPVARSMRQR